MILALNNLDKCLMTRLVLVLVKVRALLELLNGYLKFLLGLEEITLISFLLLLKELALSFPEGLVTIVVALKVTKLAL